MERKNITNKKFNGTKMNNGSEKLLSNYKVIKQ